MFIEYKTEDSQLLLTQTQLNFAYIQILNGKTH